MGKREESERRYYVTEASPIFPDLVEFFKLHGSGEMLDDYWNFLLENRDHVNDLIKVRKKKEAPLRDFKTILPQKPKRRDYEISITGSDVMSNFVNPLAPHEDVLLEFYDEADYEDVLYQDYPDYVPQARPQPCNFLVTGTRGTGKSAFSAIIATRYASIFEKRKHIRPRGQRQRVISNFWVKAVMEAGPIAFERIHVDEGRPEELIPIDPCEVDHPLTVIKERPRWVNNTELFIDEIADYTTNLRPTGRETTDMASWGRQIRKQGTENWWNTQFAHQIPGSSVGVQVDIYTRLEYNRAGDYITAYCYDFYGQFYHSNRHRVAGLNFLGNDYDWSFHIGPVSAIFDQYNTDEIIPPSWYSAQDRKRMRENQMQTDEVFI